MQRLTGSVHLSLHRRWKSTYSATILLPKTSFAARISQPQRPQHDAEVAEKAGLCSTQYLWQRQHNGPDYILHDGPPYANGQVHMGHAVNKILKDITCRYKAMAGYRVDYTPGWDCHGLPIEMKALSPKNDKILEPQQIRETARKFALGTIQEQMAAFKSWGVMADWENGTYKTLEPNYVAEQMQAFVELHEKGLVFRDLKPVYWSPVNKTALAEAELEYRSDHQSPSVFVKFLIEDAHLPEGLDSLNALIWTTTPWTLLANQAICFSPQLRYVIVTTPDSRDGLIVCGEMLATLEKTLQQKLIVVSEIDMRSVANLKYRNPLVANKGIFLTGSHVTAEKGTGLVHSAPNHGQEDYANALANNIALDPCIVDEHGKYNHLAKDLQGYDVLSKGNDKVIGRLRFLGALLHADTFTHSYPYDWRSKKPVIIRSSLQWFIDLSSLRHQAIEVLEKEVTLMPDTAKKMFINQLSVRPHWCISRQRSWGVPLPVYYVGDKPHTGRDFVERVCKLTKERGPDFWWSPQARDLLGVEDGELGKDIMDIWMDSGLSWRAVLGGRQADLYLEGSDQIRGWFQSSLLTSVALTGRAPYKKVFLHGFVLDSEGRKMSKSLGNVISPDDIVAGEEPMGVDTLRWWVAAHACTSESILVGDQVIKDCAQIVGRLRNTFRFVLGNLDNFGDSDHVEYDKLTGIDKLMLHQIYEIDRQLVDKYEAMMYDSVCRMLLTFVANEISAVYFSAIKDRLYCAAEKSAERRSACTTLRHIMDFMVRQLAPIIPHQVSDALSQLNLTLYKDAVPRCKDQWYNTLLAETGELVLKCRDKVNKITGGKSGKKVVVLYLKDHDQLKQLEQFQSDSWSTHSALTEFFQCSKVILVVAKPDEMCEEVTPDIWLKVVDSNAYSCSRCRRFVCETDKTICSRCDAVVLDAVRQSKLDYSLVA